jgi:hypothetical protein
MYCPRSCLYNLSFLQGGRAQACLFINKRIPLSKWHLHKEPDYCRVQIDLDFEPVTIHNIYSKTPDLYQTTNWNTPILRMLEVLQAPGQRLIIGDFNLYHPFWDRSGLERAYAGTDLLFNSVIKHQLDLLLQPGTITQEKNNERSTLDLV